MTKAFLLLLVAAASLRDCGHPDTKLKLEQIVFHTSPCFGACPTYHLEVNSDKTLRLHAERVYRKDKGFSLDPDSARTGYFAGTVADSTYNKLVHELETIGLDTVKIGGPQCCDGSLKTIIVYYNGQRKFFKTMFPPDEARSLIAILYQIAETSRLQRASAPFEIESGEAAGDQQ